MFPRESSDKPEGDTFWSPISSLLRVESLLSFHLHHYTEIREGCMAEIKKSSSKSKG
jgi:hypothetical protein